MSRSLFSRVDALAAATVVCGVLSGCASAPPAAPATSAAPNTSQVPVVSPSSPVSSPSPDDQAVRQRFAAWVAAFRESARAAGIGEATLHNAFDDIRYLPRVVELDRAQPEFTRPVWDYLDSAVSEQRVTQGQQKLAQVRTEADAAAARYGVPAPIVVAIWGIESNYGGNFGNTPTIDALATLGFDGRREAWAKRELMAALQIIDKGDIDHARMIGSWAGAMGQTQFMPTAFQTYAVDADGDGRRDIWGSMADVTASTANFLARSGWQAGKTWGCEVQLPGGFDYARADPATRQDAAQWAADGVRTMDGRPLPDLAEASILLPAGARGPAFLVGPNFRTILRYNNSTNYALAVALLAQRIDGGPGVQATWPRDMPAMSRAQVQDMQAELNRRGFDTGTPDGVMGPATREGIRKFQRSSGLPADGYPSMDVLERLLRP